MCADPLDPEPASRALHGAGQRAWPEIALAEQDFAAHLAGLPSTPAERAAELYLACACARGIPAALVAFERAYLSQVPSMLAGMSLSDSEIDEVRQLLRHRLLVARPGHGAPKIAGYGGQGTLRAWLRITARRVALGERAAGARRGEGRAPPDEVLAELPEPAVPPDLAHLRGRYEQVLRDAVEDAVRGLPPRQRTALRLHFLEGVTHDRIGALLQVHRTTAMRWLDGARAQILEETERQLGVRLGLSPAEIGSLIGALRSDLDLSIARLLRSTIASRREAP